MRKQKEPYAALDMAKVLSTKNKLLSLWHLMHGYHFHYFVSTVFLALAAFARTGMYIFLGNFIDRLMNEKLIGQELTLDVYPVTTPGRHPACLPMPTCWRWTR